MVKCVLDGYTYAYNPPENVNPRIKAVSSTETLSGRYHTVWGTNASRQDITQTWPAMSAAIFDALNAKSLLPGNLSYTHDDGVQYTVIATPPTFQRKVPGGIGYLGVTFKLLVVSSP